MGGTNMNNFKLCLKKGKREDIDFKTIQFEQPLEKDIVDSAKNAISILFDDKLDSSILVNYPATESPEKDEICYSNIFLAKAFQKFKGKECKLYHRDGDGTLSQKAFSEAIANGYNASFVSLDLDFEGNRFICFFACAYETVQVKKRSFVLRSSIFEKERDPLFSMFSEPCSIIKISPDFFDSDFEIKTDYRFRNPSYANKIFNLTSLITLASKEEINSFFLDTITRENINFEGIKDLSSLLHLRDKENFSNMMVIKNNLGPTTFYSKAKEVLVKDFPAFIDQRDGRIIGKKENISDLFKILSDHLYKGPISGEVLENPSKTIVGSNSKANNEKE